MGAVAGQALALRVALPPKADGPPQVMAERHPPSELAARSSAERMEPPAGARGPWGRLRRSRLGRSRKRCAAETAELAACRKRLMTFRTFKLRGRLTGARETGGSQQPGGASRNGRTLPRSRGSPSRKTCIGYSVRSLFVCSVDMCNAQSDRS